MVALHKQFNAVNGRGVFFNEVAGEPVVVSPSDLGAFMGMWFGAEDSIVVARRDVDGYWDHSTGSVEALVGVSEEGLSRLLMDGPPVLQFVEGGTRNVWPLNTPGFNAYFAVNPVVRDADGSKRGGKANVARINGLFADLDVKSGAFPSHEAVMGFVKNMAFKPSAVVSTGSGGVHAYWRLSDPLEGSQMGVQRVFTAWLQEQMEYGLDHLVDESRIMRLPGSLRYEDGEPVSSVRLLECEGYRYETGAVMEMLKGVREELEHATARRSAEDRAFNTKAQEYYEVVTSEADPFQRLKSRATAAERIDGIDWGVILGGVGWKLYREHANGERDWTRPGIDATLRSASTDPVREDGEVSGVMTLWSDSPETGLSELKAQDVHLSKMRVLQELHYNGNYKNMIDDVVAGKFDN